MGDDSKITTDIAVDDAIQLDANFRLDKHDRRYLDNQILGCETHLVYSLLSGYAATWGILDSSSANVNIGDVVCVKGLSVTKCTVSDLANAGATCGVVLAPSVPNARVHFAIDGTIPPAITGLGVGSALPVRVNTTTGRIERVGGYLSTDYPVGIADINGSVTLNLGTSPVTVSSGGMTTPTGTGFVHITSSVEDGTARAVDLNSADITNTLQVGHGGTGLTAPGTSGNVLTSNGTVWVSSTPTFASPTGTGFIHITSGTMDGAARAVNLSSADITGTLNYTAGGTGLTTLGTSLQYLRTNAAGTAIEWATLSTSGTPGGSSTQIQYNNAGVFGGTAEFTYASSKFSVSAAGSITLGTNGANVSSGYIRAPGGGTAIIYSRTSADSADFPILQTDASNNVLLGSGATQGQTWITGVGHVSLIVGATTALDTTGSATTVNGSVTTGFYGFSGQTNTITTGANAPTSTPGNGSFYLRNNGTADTTAYVRAGGAWTALSTGGGGGTPGGSTTQIQYNNAGTFGGTAEFTYASSKLNVSSTGAITFGTTPSSTANIRFSNNTTVAAVRNAANGEDLKIIATDASNNIYFGDSTAFTSTATYIRSNASVNINLGGTNIFVVDINGSHHKSGILSIDPGLNLSVGALAPTMNSATNTAYFLNGTAATANPTNGMYLSCSPDKVLGTGQFPTFIGQSSTCGIQIETSSSGTGAKAESAKLLICVPVDGTWGRYYINLRPI